MTRICTSLILLWIGLIIPASAQTLSPCRTDGLAPAELEWAVWVATSADADAAESRANLNIPAVSASKVALVTDTRICQKAVDAYSLAASVPSTGRSAIVVKIGTIYVVKDPTLLLGEWIYGMILDSKFKVILKFTG